MTAFLYTTMVHEHGRIKAGEKNLLLSGLEQLLEQYLTGYASSAGP